MNFMINFYLPLFLFVLETNKGDGHQRLGTLCHTHHSGPIILILKEKKQSSEESNF